MFLFCLFFFFLFFLFSFSFSLYLFPLCLFLIFFFFFSFFSFFLVSFVFSFWVVLRGLLRLWVVLLFSSSCLEVLPSFASLRCGCVLHLFCKAVLLRLLLLWRFFLTFCVVLLGFFPLWVVKPFFFLLFGVVVLLLLWVGLLFLPSSVGWCSVSSSFLGGVACFSFSCLVVLPSFSSVWCVCVLHLLSLVVLLGLLLPWSFVFLSFYVVLVGFFPLWEGTTTTTRLEQVCVSLLM